MSRGRKRFHIQPLSWVWGAICARWDTRPFSMKSVVGMDLQKDYDQNVGVLEWGVERIRAALCRGQVKERVVDVCFTTSETTVEWLPPTRKMAAPFIEELSEYLGSPEPAVRLILSVLLGECDVSECNVVTSNPQSLTFQWERLATGSYSDSVSSSESSPQPVSLARE